MAERAFNAYPHEVRAIQAGLQTQFRRVVKLPSMILEPGEPDKTTVGYLFKDDCERAGFYGWMTEYPEEGCIPVQCPYGQPGDKLWVRETFQRFTDDGEILYKADPAGFEAMNELKRDECLEARWRPAIHMPRWASRITLEVTGVRVEKLQDISEADAEAEGTQGGHGAIPGYAYNATPSEHYRWLWESINGPGSWDANPWVWCVSFKRAEVSNG